MHQLPFEVLRKRTQFFFSDMAKVKQTAQRKYRGIRTQRLLRPEGIRRRPLAGIFLTRKLMEYFPAHCPVPWTLPDVLLMQPELIRTK